MAGKKGKPIKSECVACNLCGKFYSNLLYHDVMGYDVVKCLHCGLIYIHPQPTKDELTNYYSNTYYSPHLSLDYAQRKREVDAKKYVELLNIIEKFKKKGKLLDIGCSYGFFIDIANKRGWEVKGIEIGITPSLYAKNNLGLEIYRGDIFDGHFEDNEFDVVTMWHVLEHTKEPLQYLLEVKRVLKADGIIAIRVPNINSFSSILLGREWPWLKLIPAHLFQFSPKILRICLERAGFSIISMKTFRGDYPYNLLLSCLIGLFYRFKLDRFLKRKLRKKDLFEVGPNASSNICSRYRYLSVVHKITEFINSILYPLKLMAWEFKLGEEIFVIANK